MSLCPECGHPVPIPGLYLAQREPDTPAVDHCSPKCGEAGDARTQHLSTAVST